MTMRVSFKISSRGARVRPKPKYETPTVLEDDDADASHKIPNNLSVTATTKPPVNITEDSNGDAEISDADISFFINLFPDGYSIGNPSENRIAHQVQDDPKFLHPYDRTSESLFLAIERGLLPADFLDDIPCKYINGAVACEVRDYRSSIFEPGVNGSLSDVSPITTKIRLKMSLENVVKDIPLISDSSWTYGDLMEAEARILKAIQPKLNLDPTPNLERLCKTPTSTKLNLHIPDLRRKRLRQMADAVSGPDNQIKKICMDRIPENSNSGQMMQQSDLVNLTTQNIGQNNMLTSASASASMSYQSKYQNGMFSAQGASPGGPGQDMMNSYGDMNKRESQDGGQLSPMGNLKRARSNPMGLDGQPGSHMDGFNVPESSQWKNSLIQQGRGIQLPNNNSGIQKYPQQMFEGGFNQDPFTMGQPGLRYNVKQEPVDSEKSKYDMAQAQAQQFSRSSFPPTPWNNLGNSLDNSRKEESFQRRKTVQSPRVSSGTLPQSPLSSKSGEFSSGGQYGVPSTAGMMMTSSSSQQREKSTVTSGPTVAGTLTSNAQMAAARRTTSLPKTQPMVGGVASPVSGPFNATSPLVGKEDKSMRDRFSKIEMLTLRYQLNNKKNKVDEPRKSTAFPTQQLNHHLFNDHNSENPKDEACKMPLSKSLAGGSMNVCKTRVLNFLQTERVLQGNGFSLVPKSRTRLILSEKKDDGSVAMHYGEMDDCDYLGAEECLPTLPNTHFADLLAAQFCTLIAREGYHVEGDHLQPKPTHTVRSNGEQPNNNNASNEMQQIPESVSGQPSNEVAKPDIGTNNVSMNNQSQNMTGGRMHPPVNSQTGMLPGGGVSMPQQSRPLQSESQPSFQQQTQHSLMLQRSSAMMLASNPLSHLNAMGQNSNMQQLGHMLNKATPQQLQMLQQQQQQPQMQQRKMMMGLGNVGIGNSGMGNAGMGNAGNGIGLQGMGNVMGMGRGGTGGAIAGPINMNQASSISNVISQQLRNGMITPAQAAIMTTKLRMAQSRNMLGAGGGQNSNIAGLTGGNRQVLPGSGGYSMLGPTMNRANTMNPMQRTAMAPPKLMSGMNVYMNQQQQQQQMHVQQQQQQMTQQMQQMPGQQQESTSPLQAVLSPPQQVGSPGMGVASPQQRTPMSPQLSSGGVHPGGQEGNCPASPQLSSQTMGSVNSMNNNNSPMEMQGVNKSS